MRSMQLTLLTMIAVLLSTSTFASYKEQYYKDDYKGEAMPCPSLLYLTTGFYFGAQAGYDTYRAETDVTDRIPGVTPTATLDPDLALYGPEVGVFLGYGYYFTQFYNLYLGVEGFANATSAKVPDYEVTVTTPGSVSEYENGFHAEYNFGVSILPGIKVSANTLAYIRLGYNGAQFAVPQNAFLNGTEVGDVDKTTIANGFQYGLGFEAAFDRSWSIRVEYTHTGFSDFSTSNGATFDMSDNQFTLGAIYHIHYWP